ncbi:MAG: DNA mismatch repair endonuclease MutL [Desulfobacterales bacterium]
MSKIKILPEILSNKIAAGEVVERPASVVKELLENSIDAGSTRIIIDIENGGRSLIRVSDNGSGMNHDDALLCIERYATSKIHNDADLFSIRTLGFRGEALPSIASVCRFSMITRDRDSETGTHILADGGRIRNVSETGAPIGTMVEVKQLFFNTPARRKFLKSTNTEMGHIAETISGIALGKPEIGFQLLHNGKKIKNWPIAQDPFDRISVVFGQDIRSDLHEIQLETEDASVSGWISSPSLTRSSSQKIYLYVNGRFIRDRGLQHALFEGYRGRLMKGRFPVAVLFIHVPVDQLDVNVHPTKHEVRFAGYRKVYETLKAAVFNAWNRMDHPKKRLSASIKSVPGSTPETPPNLSSELSSTTRHEEREIPFQHRYQKASFEIRGPSEPEATISETTHAYCETQKALSIKTDKSEEDGLQRSSIFSSINVIGQLHNTYIICESENEMVLIDQHAAHERILFEQLKKKSLKSSSPAQKYLIPETIDLGYQESAILEKLIPGLAEFGLEIEPFGGCTFAIKSAPEIISGREIKPMILEIVDKIGDIGFSEGIERVMDNCLILMACHGSIRAGQRLSEQEIKALIYQLECCENTQHCPHGRPIRVSWQWAILEKQFKRIV